ncbi:MAG TPA: ATP-binding cassette domain-containing protein [Actinomycetota bacterium]|nr:ATP-binding cassette domain-containing protein [Actinomycetota bacterium]
MAIIRADGLVRRFGSFTAVDNVSFEVEPGEVFGFLGPNGAGKTTTISILCTLLAPTSGRAEVNGFDVQSRRDAVRASIGIVFQDPSLDVNLTAAENLRFHADVYGVPRAEAARRSDELLTMVDLYDRRDKSVMTYSGGMRRRLELARGLLHHPVVLFLDEPTIGLDPQSRTHMWNYVLDLARKQGITLFLTTHYLEEAEHCNRIAIMDQGQIIALDTPAGLKRSVGGDTIVLSTADDGIAEDFLRSRMGLDPRRVSDGIHVAVQVGEAAIPQILGALPVAVTTVKLSRPTLDDVFIEKTGRHLRDEETSPGDAMRERFASRMRSGRRV